MKRVAPAAACRVCGRELGWRRARVGIGVHPGCKRLSGPGRFESTLAQARAVLASVRSRAAADDELGEMFAAASHVARDLIDDLARLRSYLARRS